MAEAAALVAEMTLAEKLDCLDGDLDPWPGIIEMSTGGYHERTFPAAEVERLGIPGITFSDGPRGCVIGEKTAFPVPMARAATFDHELEREIGAAIGAELRAAGANFYGGVCVNLVRHPGWGRAQESYGEEPHLLAQMGSALALGAQEHVIACVKHFALNSMENARFSVDITCDERALHEVYLPHFQRIVEAGVGSVMSAYNSVNGHWCAENRTLLTDVLRSEWGFEGFVISDFVFGLRDGVASVHAGLDIEMPFRQLRAMHLPAAIDDGRLSESVVDASVTRIVATLLRFARRWSTPKPELVLSDRHRTLARTAAARSVVLLRNDHDVLPLRPALVRTVAVLGHLARVDNLGDRGSSDVIAPDPVTILDGLRAALPGAHIVHHDHDPMVVKGADVAIVVVGHSWRDEGEYVDPAGTAGLLPILFPPLDDAAQAAMAEMSAQRAGASAPSREFGSGGDRRSLELSADDEALILAAAELHERVVVLVMGGSIVTMERWRHQVSAIALVWYPGIEGGHGIADVLIGAVDASGRLPLSIPTDASHLPHFDPDATAETYDGWHGHWKLTRDGNQPAYPFGFGLSYTSIVIEAAERHGDAVAVTCHNDGLRAGDEVVQVYGSVPGSRYERPAERLVGFARSHLGPGERQRLMVPVDLRHLWIRAESGWVVEDGVRLVAARHAGDPDAVVVDP